jgi:outer membrane protein assembly factor BamB
MNAFTRQGAVRWSRSIEGFPISSQFTPDGHLIFITQIGKIYVLRRDNGAPVIEPVALLPGVSYTPRPRDYRGCLIGSSESTCYSANTLSIDQDTGVFYFTLTRPEDPLTRLVAMRYVMGNPPRIEPLWENATLQGGSASSPNISADGSRLYVNDRANHLLALDADTGDVIWSYDLGFSPLGSPSSSTDGVIMPTGGLWGGLMALQDVGDHAELLWARTDVDSHGITVQRGTDRAYAVVTDAGWLFGIRLLVIDARDGTTLDEEPISPLEAVTVGTTMSEDGHVFVPGILGGLWGFKPNRTP